jgi:hypothetical protein
MPVTVHSIGSASPLVAQGDIESAVDLARNRVADLLRFINFGNHHGNQPELLADDSRRISKSAGTDSTKNIGDKTTDPL